MSEKTLRGLSSEFMQKLQDGREWQDLIKKIKQDNTLHFQIRNNYINVYYRGCSILRLDEKGNIAQIADKYYTSNLTSLNEWLEKLPLIKNGVDCFNPPLEREYQQIVAKVNTLSKISNGTDYFIVDTEMADSEQGSRFDMVAIKWESDGTTRKSDKKCQLAIFEMKYGFDSLTNEDKGELSKGDLRQHFIHVLEYGNFENLKKTAIEQFKQLRKLDLVNLKNASSKENNENPVNNLIDEVELVVLLADYDPESTQIEKHFDYIRQNDIENKLKDKGIILKFATSNFMGYGLYSNAMLDFKEFEELYKTRNKK